MAGYAEGYIDGKQEMIDVIRAKTDLTAFINSMESYKSVESMPGVPLMRAEQKAETEEILRILKIAQKHRG